jgi:MFS family permease
MIPSLVPRSSLVNAIAMNASISQLSQIAGPALAGVLIATVDLGPAYAVNAALFAGAMLAIFAIRTSPVRPAITDNPWTSFVEGLGFVRRQPVILSLLAVDLSESILGSYRALLPVVADLLGVREIGYGLLSAAPGIGSVMGAAVMLSLGDVRYKGLYTIFGVLSYCVALAVLGLAPWFPLALMAAAMLGVGNSVQMIPRNTVILAIPPDVLRGRVEAFRSMVTGGGPPLGFMLSGALAASLGVPLALTLGAAGCAVVVGCIGLFHRALRDPDLGSMSPEEPSESP